MNFALIGCGNIGILYDYKNPKKLLTYYSAINSNKFYKLVAVCDLNQKKKKLIPKHINFFSNIKKMFIYSSVVDAAIISSSTSSHYRVLMQVLKSKVQYIICEKPFVLDIYKAKKIIKLIKKNKKKIIINYSRRFSPEIVYLASKINNNFFGNIERVSITTSRGLINSGCHYIDLIRMIFGDNINVSGKDLYKSKYIKNDFCGKVNFLVKNKIIVNMEIKDLKNKFCENIFFYTKKNIIKILDYKKIIFINIKNQNKKIIKINRSIQITNLLKNLNNTYLSSAQNALKNNIIINKIIYEK
jgi:hypothetical protein